jgi:hypothetical protein
VVVGKVRADPRRIELQMGLHQAKSDSCWPSGCLCGGAVYHHQNQPVTGVRLQL